MSKIFLSTRSHLSQVVASSRICPCYDCCYSILENPLEWVRVKISSSYFLIDLGRLAAQLITQKIFRGQHRHLNEAESATLSPDAQSQNKWITMSRPTSNSLLG